MIAIVYTKLGPFYEPIEKRRINTREEFEELLKEWKYADLIELYDDNDELICEYSGEKDYEECIKYFNNRKDIEDEF
ncbi:MAG: hypothetical protein OWQ54_06485 [Sulfolobaceae archaeon]|nr:hypothetical protein [Sulfolobaceae archaeon]